jgi:hypothetical protein
LSWRAAVYPLSSNGLLGFGGLMDDKVWIHIDVVPRPISDIERTQVHIFERGDCATENISSNEANNHTIKRIEFTRPGLFFEIDPKQLLFFWGEVFEAGSGLTQRKVLSILAPRPLRKSDKDVTANNSARENECCTEIRLTIFPKGEKPKGTDIIFGKKKNGGASNSYWKKIKRRLFKPIYNRA